MCNYEMQFSTPYACKEERVKELRSVIQSVMQSSQFEFDQSDFTIQFDLADCSTIVQ